MAEKIKKVAVRVVENTDYNVHYGILVVEAPDVTAEIIQDKIYEIKSTFVDPDDVEDVNELADDVVLSDEYTLDDIISRFPDDWKVEFYEDNSVEI